MVFNAMHCQSGRSSIQALGIRVWFSVIMGLAFKLGAVPFHMWIDVFLGGAPTAVTLIIGGAPQLAALR
jgi:NADH-quinone oxidoreductase subunit N